MNKKLYIRWQMKKWIPLFLIMVVLFVLYFGVGSIANPVYPESAYNIYVTGYYGLYGLFSAVGRTDAGLMQILPQALVSSFILPLFVYGFRYDKNAADAFGQFPAKPGQIRRIRVLIALTMLLAAVTSVYWLGVGIRALRQATFKDALNGTVPFYFFNYGYYALFYLYMMVVLSAQFLFNCAVCSLAGRASDSVILMAVSEAILAGFLPLVGLMSEVVRTEAGITLTDEQLAWFPSVQGFSFVNPLMATENVFEPLIYGSEVSNLGALNVMSWIVYPFLLGASGVWVFLEKDPSGEYFGKPGGVRDLGEIMIHICFALVGVAIGYLWFFMGRVSLSAIELFLLISLFGIAFFLYYLILAMYFKTFKISKRVLHIYLIVLIGSFLFEMLLLVMGIAK